VSRCITSPAAFGGADANGALAGCAAAGADISGGAPGEVAVFDGHIWRRIFGGNSKITIRGKIAGGFGIAADFAFIFIAWTVGHGALLWFPPMFL
jgi:hypothetical protein